MAASNMTRAEPAAYHTTTDNEGQTASFSVAHSDDEKASKSLSPWDPSSFPEGGTQAWLTVAGGSACLFVSFGWINTVGIFQAYYQVNQLREYSTSEISWIPSLQIFFMLFGGPFIGRIFDYYGPRYLLLVGGFLHVFGLMMTSISHTYYQILLSQAVCSAIGASMLFNPGFACALTWFYKKRGAALGGVAVGSSLGGVIFPIMVTRLIPRVGFGWTMRICAFLILGLVIFANLTVRSRLPPSKTRVRLFDFVRPLGETPFLLVTAAIFFFYWGMFIPFTFIVVEAQSLGMSARLADYLVPILNAASVLGRAMPNALSDKLGRYNIIVVMSAFTFIIMLGLWVPASSNAALIVFSVLFGFGSGAGIGLTPALVAQISPLKEIGTRQGTALGIAAFAALSGSPIGGAIIGADRGQFRYAIVFGGVVCAVGCFLFVVTRIKLAGFKMVKV